MSQVTTILYTAAAFTTFGLIHSITVSSRFKAMVSRIIGETRMKAYYRLGFTLISIGSASVAAWFISTLPDTTVYSTPVFIVIPARAVQLLGAALLFAALFPFDTGYFLGIKQAARFIKTGQTAGDIEGIPTGGLVAAGVYRIIRHPMYLGGILLLAFDPLVTHKTLTVRALAVAYFIWGMHIEDKRLMEAFGKEYRAYRRRFTGPMGLFARKGQQ